LSKNGVMKMHLARLLSEHLAAFECQQRIPSVHGFGIEHGRELSELTVEECKDVAEMSGIKRSLGTELHKGMKLEPYVQRRLN